MKKRGVNFIYLATAILSTIYLIFLFFSEYCLLIYAYEDYQELLVTAIVDTPPEYDNQVIIIIIITIILIVI